MLFTRLKVFRKVLRFGNLDAELRPFFWKSITHQPEMCKKVIELAELEEIEPE